MNTFKSPRFIKLKHSINSCTNHLQLDNLWSLVQNYSINFKDGGELMQIYLDKKAQVVEYFEEPALNIHHSKLSSK